MASSSILGIDLGGTKTVMTRFDAGTLERQEERRWATRAKDGMEEVLKDIVLTAEELRRADTTGVGIGVPGLVAQPEGRLINAPNIKDARDLPLKLLLEEQLQLPVTVDNDANCFVLVESAMGAAVGKKVVVGITFGTGVGGGVVIDGNIFRGAHGYAAEIGHMLLLPGKPPYETDYHRGEVEQFLSGTALGKRCPSANDPREYLEGDTCSFLRPDIFREIAWLCTNLTHLLDPDMIVFGGSTGHAFQPHLEDIRREQQEWMLPGTPVPELAIARLKDAGTLGAALLMRA